MRSSLQLHLAQYCDIYVCTAPVGIDSPETAAHVRAHKSQEAVQWRPWYFQLFYIYSFSPSRSYIARSYTNQSVAGTEPSKVLDVCWTRSRALAYISRSACMHTARSSANRQGSKSVVIRSQVN